VTKAAIVHLTKCRARIFAPKVRVNAVAPGVIENTRWNADNPNFNMQTYQAGANNVPLKRLGEPEDIAEAVYYLASENASYITGPILPVEGGMCVQA
jgi:3-oxoacyl-[acyl-carrier protein] reductase